MAGEKIDDESRTYYVVQSFSGPPHRPVLDEPYEAASKEAAASLAERLAPKKLAVVAFSRTGNFQTGEFEDAIVIASFGRIPECHDLRSEFT
ncbi:hypothetical protein LRS73_17555 [Methylobacterium currus]|uniref:hypothetical protein n=1 Tax=Methylobacterium currus TaxID=2051553 RepID=UPI001E5ED25B|nr:hypothetical protein [Methylobacterium currus]UHC14367.1 hypothetical protein LRS73_17555 [Methylobacterium currus]